VDAVAGGPKASSSTVTGWPSCASISSTRVPISSYKLPYFKVGAFRSWESSRRPALTQKKKKYARCDDPQLTVTGSSASAAGEHGWLSTGRITFVALFSCRGNTHSQKINRKKKKQKHH
jgi:hypothetical protein